MQAIDPNIDVALDPQKQAWKYGATGLDATNAAPLATDAVRGLVKKWLWIVSIIAAFVLFCVVYNKYKVHKAAVAAATAVKPVPVMVAPEPIKSVKKPVKNATNNIATKSINTTAMPSFEAEKAPFKKTQINDGFTTEFDKELARFETNLKKEFP